MKKIILSLSCFLILFTQTLCAFGPLNHTEERSHSTASQPSPQQPEQEVSPCNHQDSHPTKPTLSLQELEQEVIRLSKELIAAKESFVQPTNWGTTWDTLHSLAHPLVRVSENLTSGLIAHVIVGQMLPPQLQSTWDTLHSLAHPLVRVSENLTSGLIAHVIVGQMLPPQLQRFTCNMLGQALPLGAFVSASLQKEISSQITGVIHQVEEAAWNTFLASVLQTTQ